MEWLCVAILFGVSAIFLSVHRFLVWADRQNTRARIEKRAAERKAYLESMGFKN